MKIINKITDKNYIQWIENFVENIIIQSVLECNEVTIEDVDCDRIYLNIDGEDYDIRTWSYRPVKLDSNGKVCAEMVRYTLFKMVMDDDNSGHGEELNYGCVRIEWSNENN